jgi:hypothetical protein
MAEIYKALAAVNKSIKAIGKDRTNQQQGFKFRGIDDVMNELHSLFAANEIIIFQTVNEVNVTERTNQRGTALFFVRINVTYQFTHSDGSHADITVYGEAMDSGDKATTKAMSIALKYALLQMFLIPTEEEKDPDAVAHEVKAKLPESNLETSPEFTEALTLVETCDTTERLKDIWSTYKTFQGVKIFKDAVKAKKAELTKTLA